MNIRKATKNDINQIIDIINNNLTVINALDYPKPVIDFMLAYYSKENIDKWIDDFTLFLVAEEDAKVVGNVALDGNELKALYVAPKKQGKGIGRKLINDLENRSKGKKIFMYASLTAYDFYTRLGYTTVRKEEDPQMGMACLMEKEL